MDAATTYVQLEVVTPNPTTGPSSSTPHSTRGGRPTALDIGTTASATVTGTDATAPYVGQTRTTRLLDDV